MWKDPIVEEVRKHREAHAAKFGYDISAICRDLRRREEASVRKIVSFPAKRIQPRESDKADAEFAATKRR